MDFKKNKERAIKFYKMSLEGNLRKAVELFVGSEYIKHNPIVEDSPQGFIDYFERMEKEHPHKYVEFVRSIDEGDIVALHTHQIWLKNEKYVTMDFFRFDDKGKNVEHWDSIQKILEKSANQNTMY